MGACLAGSSSWSNGSSVLGLEGFRIRDPYWGTTASTLQHVDALAVTAPLALAMFGTNAESPEFIPADADLVTAHAQGLSKKDFQDAVWKARTLVYCTLHCKLTSGHAWMSQLAGGRKKAALMLQAVSYGRDLLSDASNLRATTAGALDGRISLFRICLHPVDIRAMPTIDAEVANNMPTQPVLLDQY